MLSVDEKQVSAVHDNFFSYPGINRFEQSQVWAIGVFLLLLLIFTNLVLKIGNIRSLLSLRC